MKQINRRSFLKKASLFGAGTLLGRGLWGRIIGATPRAALAETNTPELVSIKGKDYFANTAQAIEQLGGIETFVKQGDRVGLLVNSPFKHFGTSVNPDITLAVIDLCREAGAKEIRYLKDPHRRYWKRSALAEKYAAALNDLKYESGDKVKLDIPGAKVLKDAKVNKDLMACDVFINLSITKHHDGVHYTGALKNMMGLCPFSTNSYFHFGTLKLGWYRDIEHLSQCIADLNLVRKPDLCVSDATAFITEKGPYGPGKLAKPEMVVAARNRVSLDAFCCKLLGLDPKNILMIRKAAEHGLGEMDLNKVALKTLKV